MFLVVRMILYAAFAMLSGTGIGLYFDPGTGMVSMSVYAMSHLIVGAVGFFGTFWASRIAKRRGGQT